MHRVLQLLPLLLVACGTSTTPTSSLYHVAVVSSPTHTNMAGDYIRDVTLLVTGVGTGQPATGIGIRVAVTGGSVASTSLISGSTGEVALTWTIPAAATTPGTVYSLAFCALNPGEGFCAVDVNGPDVIKAAF